MAAKRKWKENMPLLSKLAEIANSQEALLAPSRNRYLLTHPDLKDKFTDLQQVDKAIARARDIGIEIADARKPKGQERLTWAMTELGIPVSAKPVLTQQRLTGNHLILTDLHVPYHDAELIEMACKKAQQYGIKRAVLGGDTFDATAFGKHTQEHRMLKGDPRNLGELQLLDAILCGPGGQMFEAARVLRAIISAGIEVIEWRNGNHDIRPMKILGFEFAPEQILAMLDAKTETGACNIRLQDHIRINQFRWVEIDCGPIPWRVTHPKNFSVIPTRVAQGIADRELCHVFCAHGHCHAISPSAAGFLAIDTGGLYDPRRQEYQQHWDNRYPNVQPGFWYIVDGEVGAYGETIRFEPGEYNEPRYGRLTERVRRLAETMERWENRGEITKRQHIG